MAKPPVKKEASTESGKVVVVFTKPWTRYSPKDVAGFDAETAEKLINIKVAEPFEAAAEQAEGKQE
ncbi:hypothetical protein ACE02U_09105 [Shewanella xiamenensis]|uniref:hypothetical protein n=1 Tax=Shewanella xiamenensis TaxID=332186 RepID=UPI0035B7B339